MRKGLGKGKGQGYKNILPMDSHIHSLSAKGQKTYNSLQAKKKLVYDGYATNVYKFPKKALSEIKASLDGKINLFDLLDKYEEETGGDYGWGTEETFKSWQGVIRNLEKAGYKEIWIVGDVSIFKKGDDLYYVHTKVQTDKSMWDGSDSGDDWKVEAKGKKKEFSEYYSKSDPKDTMYAVEWDETGEDEEGNLYAGAERWVLVSKDTFEDFLEDFDYEWDDVSHRKATPEDLKKLKKVDLDFFTYN